MSKRLQVFVFGHGLSETTKRFLMTQGSPKVFTVPLHIDRFDLTFETIDAVFAKLMEQGADLSGRTRTMLVAPGSSVGAMTLVAAWMGTSGELPKILNLIRRGEHYVPSPEKPILDLHSYKNLVRKAYRERTLTTGTEIIRAPYTLESRLDAAVGNSVRMAEGL